MVVVLYLKVVLELATAHCISASFSTPSEGDCSRLCILNDTCYRYWSSIKQERSHWSSTATATFSTPFTTTTTTAPTTGVTTDQSKSCLDHPGYKYEGPGLCVKLVTTKMTWEKARETCQADGASLVKIDSELKNIFLKTTYSTCKYYWLGGNDISNEGQWEWTDGTPIQGFLDWTENEPDGGRSQNCMTMGPNGWYNGGCSDAQRVFVCEIVEK